MLDRHLRTAGFAHELRCLSDQTKLIREASDLLSGSIEVAESLGPHDHELLTLDLQSPYLTGSELLSESVTSGNAKLLERAPSRPRLEFERLTQLTWLC